MGEPWATKKELEAALRQIHLRLGALAAAGGGGGEENMVYDTAASHTHSGGGAYETVLNITSGKGRGIVFLDGSIASAAKYHTLKITVDGVVVLNEAYHGLVAYGGPSGFGGEWYFNTSFKVEHKSAHALTCHVAYYLE